MIITDGKNEYNTDQLKIFSNDSKTSIVYDNNDTIIRVNKGEYSVDDNLVKIYDELLNNDYKCFLKLVNKLDLKDKDMVVGYEAKKYTSDGSSFTNLNTDEILNNIKLLENDIVKLSNKYILVKDIGSLNNFLFDNGLKIIDIDNLDIDTNMDVKTILSMNRKAINYLVYSLYAEGISRDNDIATKDKYALYNYLYSVSKYLLEYKSMYKQYKELLPKVKEKILSYANNH